MQVAKKVPFDDPNTLNMVRAGYILSNLIILGMYYYIGMVVKKKNGADTPPLEVEAMLTKANRPHHNEIHRTRLPHVR